MATAMDDIGGFGIIHRMMSVEDQFNMINNMKTHNVGFSIGIGDDWQARMDYRHNSLIACLDVAHGHHKRVIEIVTKYFQYYPNFPLIIGQVSTAQAVKHFLSVIPKRYHENVAFKTSIGGGSLCTTRIQTAHGIPTLQAVMDIREQFPDVCIIADGGIKNSGDIVKALAAGANAVMLGSLLSGTDETPGDVIDGHKHYQGSASFNNKLTRGEETRNVEGESILVKCKGPVKDIVKDLLDGVRSGFSYSGANNLKELQENAQFIEITQAGYNESLPHGKK
jgi:IMP dehydrogenase